MDIDDIWIDFVLNEYIWSRGIQKPPVKIRVKTLKWEDGRVDVMLPDDDE